MAAIKVPDRLDIHVYFHFDKFIIEYIENKGDLTEAEARTLIANAAPTLEKLKAVGKS